MPRTSPLRRCQQYSASGQRQQEEETAVKKGRFAWNTKKSKRIKVLIDGHPGSACGQNTVTMCGREHTFGSHTQGKQRPHASPSTVMQPAAIRIGLISVTPLIRASRSARLERARHQQQTRPTPIRVEGGADSPGDQYLNTVSGGAPGDPGRRRR